MARVDISQAFVNFMDRASSNPIENFGRLDLDNFANLDAFDLDEPDFSSISSTSILGRTGSSSVEFKGTGFSPTNSFDAFSEAVDNGTARGTLTGIEARDASGLVFGAALTATTLTLTSGNLVLTIDGRFPTAFIDVINLLNAVDSFGEDFDFITPAEQAEFDRLLARYSVTDLTLREAGAVVLELDLAAGRVEIELADGFSGVFAGSFGSGLGDNLSAISVVTSIVSEGRYFEEDGITVNTVTLLSPQDVPFYTATGPFAQGDRDFAELSDLFVAGRQMDSLRFGESEGSTGNDVVTLNDRPTDLGTLIAGFGGNDSLTGGANGDMILGGTGNDSLQGLGGDDSLYGGDGTDVINGGDGNDMLFGGATAADLRDVIFGGDGNDTIDGGHGNDELRGDAGNDSIAGGFGADTVIGGTGNDTLTGSAFGDLLVGGDGDDFVNGGFGFDRVNGGDGADVFYHLGIADHGSDWIQDFTHAQGDVLVFGNGTATRSQFQINEAFTAGAGADDVAEAFVVYRPTGQIIWALVDGAGQDEITLRIGGDTFDLMA